MREARTYLYCNNILSQNSMKHTQRYVKASQKMKEIATNNFEF